MLKHAETFGEISAPFPYGQDYARWGGGGKDSPEGTFPGAPHLWQGQRFPWHSLYPFLLLWLALFVVSVSDLVELLSLTSRRPLLSPRPGWGVYRDSPSAGT